MTSKSLSDRLSNSLLEILFSKCASYKSLNFELVSDYSQYKSMKYLKEEVGELKDNHPHALVYVYAIPKSNMSKVINSVEVVGGPNSNKVICFGTAKTCHDNIHEYQGEDSPHSYVLESFIGSVKFDCMDN